MVLRENYFFYFGFVLDICLYNFEVFLVLLDIKDLSDFWYIFVNVFMN